VRSPPCGSVGSPGFDRHAACGQGPVLWFMASSMDHDGPTAMEVEPLESHRCERFRALLHSVSTRPAEQPLLPPRDVREYLRFCQGESTPPCSPERQGTDPHPDCCSWRESLGDLRRSCQFVRGCISVLDQIVQWRLTAGESVQSPKPKPWRAHSCRRDRVQMSRLRNGPDLCYLSKVLHGLAVRQSQLSNGEERRRLL